MNKRILFSLLFGAALVMSVNTLQAQNTESYESLMKKGNEKYNAKDYISAKTYYEMALKQKKDDPTARKKLDETVKKIQEDGARQEVFYAHLDTGDQFFAQERYEEALSEYELALKVFPNDKYVSGRNGESHPKGTPRQARRLRHRHEPRRGSACGRELRRGHLPV